MRRFVADQWRSVQIRPFFFPPFKDWDVCFVPVLMDHSDSLLSNEDFVLMSLSALKLPVWRTRCAFSSLCQHVVSLFWTPGLFFSFFMEHFFVFMLFSQKQLDFFFLSSPWLKFLADFKNYILRNWSALVTGAFSYLHMRPTPAR